MIKALILMWAAIISMMSFMIWNGVTTRQPMLYIDMFNVFIGLSNIGFLVAWHRRKT